jgi:serine/threonine protein kinase
MYLCFHVRRLLLPQGTRHGFQGNLHTSHRSVYLLHTIIHNVTAEVVQMILQLALRIEELHSLGYVHLDLKPGNVMWLPWENRWTVIDFGCVARTGESARLVFSIKYAAPEVIAAYRKGAQTIVAQVFNLCADILVLNQECFFRNAQVCSLSSMGRYKAAK